MRHLTTCVTICLLFSFSACKKNSHGEIPPENPNNEFKATISATGRPDISIVANGGYTIFAKETWPSGDTVIIVSGSNDERQVVLHLENIRSAGTYHFLPGAGADPRQMVTCSYTIGSPFAPTGFYVSSRPAATETVIITSLTATHIAGSFSVTCSDANGDVLVKNVTFNGDF